MSPRLAASFSLALLSCLSSTAFAQPLLQGNLELLWGDAAPGDATLSPQFNVNLVDAAGQRQPLDAQQSLWAAGDLFSLAGHSVALTLQPGPWPGGRLAPAALVDAGEIDSPASPAVTGAQPWVTILCKFSDIAAEPKNLAYFGTMLSNQTGRLDHYWREVSYNKANVSGSLAYGWFTLPSPRSTYITTDANNHQTADLGKLFNDCTGVADPTVNFAPFVGVNTMYNGDLDGYAWGGNRYAALDGPQKNWYVTWEPKWGYENEAPLTHEMGHGFGLPHANNSDLDSDPYDNTWDVMSDGWHNAASDTTYGAQPKHLNIWSRNKLGWIDAARKLTVSTDGIVSGITLDRASLIGSTHTQMIVVTLPSPEPATHYYVIEARKKVGYYEAKLAGDAVIIHEVNTTRSEPSWSVDATVPPATIANNAGSMFVVGESWIAPNNALRVDVTGATTDGFLLNVRRGNVPDELIFKNGFE
ncbi:MAG: hypothetical protein ABIO49_16735 [Dokdonella sp.]